MGGRIPPPAAAELALDKMEEARLSTYFPWKRGVFYDAPTTMAMLDRYWVNPVMAPDTTPVELLLFLRRA